MITRLARPAAEPRPRLLDGAGRGQHGPGRGAAAGAMGRGRGRVVAQPLWHGQKVAMNAYNRFYSRTIFQVSVSFVMLLARPGRRVFILFLGTLQQLPTYRYPATPTLSTSLTHLAPRNAPPRSVVPACVSAAARIVSKWNTTPGPPSMGRPPTPNCAPWQTLSRYTTRRNNPAPQHLGSLEHHGRPQPHQAPRGPTPQQGARIAPHQTNVGAVDGLQRHAPQRRLGHRQTGVPPLHVQQRTRGHACKLPEYQPHPRARTRATRHPAPQRPAAPTPHTLWPHSQPTGYPRTRRARIERSSTRTARPSDSWPPCWATQRTSNSYDASKTASIPPSATHRYAWIATQHTYKNP